MTQELLNALAGSARAYLFGITGQIVGLLFACTMMKRRRNIWKLFWFVNIKSIIAIIAIDSGIFDKSIPSVVLYSTLVSMLGTIGTYLMFAYTFQGGLLKIIAGLSIAELLVGILWLPITILLNYIEGRENLYLFYGQPQWVDLLLIPMAAVLTAIVYPFIRKFLQKYRSYQMKNRVLWGIILGVYFCGNQMIAFTDVRNGNVFMGTMYLFYLATAICAASALYLAYWRYQSRIHIENEFLTAQMSLMETHHTAIRNQVEKIAVVQKSIEEQMERLNKTDAGNKEQTMEYLENLRREYDGIRAGVYCKDWMVDVILYCQEEAAKKLGIKVEYQFAGYERGCVAEEDAARIVFLLLDEGIQRQAKTVILRAGAVKGKLILELKMEQLGRKGWFSKGKYLEVLQKYDGNILTEKRKDRICVGVEL